MPDASDEPGRLGGDYLQLAHNERDEVTGVAVAKVIHRFGRAESWLALLLIRVIENEVEDTWRNIRHELDGMPLVTLATSDGHVAQRSVTTPGQKTILAALKLSDPPVLRLHPRNP